MRVTGQLGGPTIAAAAGGNMVLAGAGYRVTVYDSSNPTALREIGSTASFSDFVRGIAVVGTRAYVAAGASGLHVVDLSDPTNPSVIGTWDSPGSAESVTVDGTIAYLADGPFGMRILDLSIPSNPTPLGTAFDDFVVFDVAISGKTAMVAAGGAGLLLADVSDPRAPIELAQADSPGYARGVAASGAYAVLADQWEGIRIFDAANPRLPIEIGSFPTQSWAFDVAVSDSTAFVATGSAGLTVIDLADPATPRQTGTLPVAAGDAVAVATTGSRAFLAAGRAGLLVIDVTNRATPQVLDVITSLADGLGVAAAASHIFVAAGPGFTVVDASNPARPREVGVFGSPGEEFGTYVATSSGYAYLGASGSLVTFDVRDPPRALETSRVDLGPAAFRGMAIKDGLLAAATEFDLVILDISQPAVPVLRAKVPMFTGPHRAQAVGVALSGRYAFVAQSQAGMAVVDLVDPALPVVIAQYGADPLYHVAAIAAANGFAYVPKCGRLEVVNVSNPANPQLVTSLSLIGCPYRATLAGQSLYLATGTDGVFEIDVSNPLQPAIISRTVLPGFASEVAVANSSIVVSVVKLGLFLLEKRGASAASTVTRVVAVPDPVGVTRAAIARPSTPPPQIDDRLLFRSAVLLPEPLAARQIVVNSTTDSGPGALRDAIASAFEGDVITFDPAVFPPASPAVIRPATQFGCVQRSVTLDASNAGVVLDGSMLPTDQLQNGIHLCSQGATVKGLQIINFPGSAIAVSGTENTIGGDPSRGTGPVGEGNLASGNRDSGIVLAGSARRNRIVGNLLGPAPAGLALRYQQRLGVFFARAAENVAGGTSAAERNVISGNQIDVSFIVASHNTVAGNYIGTDATGTRIAPTQMASSSEIGVNLEGGSGDNLIVDNVIASGQAVVIADAGSGYNRIIRNRVGIGPHGERIAGTTASLGSGIVVAEPYNLVADNIIGGLRGAAVHITAPAEVYVLGNRIGTDPSGTASIPNASFEGSILLRGAHRAFIGGASASERNVISGNNAAGIELRGPGNEQNFIVGNSIGVSAFGAPLGNGAAGIRISSSQQNFIQRNTITANAVGIESTEGSRNRIRRNSIFANTNAGIQDFTAQPPAVPVISEVGLDYVKGTACAGCLIEIFSDQDDEGRWFEGETLAASDGNFTMRKTGGILRGPRVSGTATGLSGATSVFSGTVQAPPPPPRRRAVRR